MKNIQKIIVYFAFSLCSSWLTNAQSSDQNWVKTTIYKKEGQQNPAHEVTYFDGLGRPIQKVANAQSNSGKDIVTHIEYDVYGRQVKDFLPYVNQTPSLNYNGNAASEIAAYYNTVTYQNTSNPFSEKLLEASPLDRVFKQAAPGNDWRMNGGHEIKLDYSVNIANEVKYYTVTTTWNASKQLFDTNIANSGSYNVDELYKNITKNENWTSGVNNTTEEFKDKEGRVVLKRTYNNGDAHDTYYVYDDFGNLTYVIPPLANGAYDQNTLDGLCYQYKYDNRNRLAAKKLPGKQWEFIVYDKLDRPVATGPVFSPYGDGTVGIMVTQYDVLGRVSQTGWLTQTVNETNRGSWQTTINGGSNPFLLVANDILTKNYYDTYNFPNAPTIPSDVEGQSVVGTVKGLATGMWVRILTNPSLVVGETSYTLYDHNYRPIRTNTVNYLGGFTQVDSKLDFIGKALYTITTHKRTTADVVLTVKDNFVYSAQERLIKHTQQINGGAEQLIASNTYDELGQLTSKKVGGNDASGQIGLQKVDYSYNIRGWLKSINNPDTFATTNPENDLFAFKLNYNDNQSGTAFDVSPLYNGNISESLWISKNDNVLRKYGYQYDDLNRLTAATYQKPDDAVKVTNSYNEMLSYDKNGNILTLSRTGDYESPIYQINIDNLAYTYDSLNKNRLLKVSDATNNPSGYRDTPNLTGRNDFDYDANGNLIADSDKGITNITYNHLNLPVQIDFSINGRNPKIVYLYDATGRKVNKIADEIITSGIAAGTYQQVATDYLQGGFQYKSNQLLFFPHAEGYVKNTNGVFAYVFNYTDHLGNIRLSYCDADNNGVLGNEPKTTIIYKGGLPRTTIVYTNGIEEESNYYPFGLKHFGYNINNYQQNYKYKYNGKELQDELGLNVYDYDNRVYDPAVGSFWEMDPKTELGRRWSPYNYCFDNPIYFQDPDGMWPNPFKGLLTAIKKDVISDLKAVKKVVSENLQKLDNLIRPNGVMFWVDNSDLKKDGLVQPDKPKDRSKVKTADASGVDAATTVTSTSNEARGRSLKERTEGVTSVSEKADEVAKNTDGNSSISKTNSTNSEPMVNVKVEHYTATDIPNNKSQVALVGTKDTSVVASDKKNVEKLNEDNKKREEKVSNALNKKRGFR